MSVEEKVLEVIKEPVEKLNITVKEVLFEKEKGVFYLKIFIDKEPFVSIDDCVLVTNTVNPILDEHDFIENSYMLDISSVEKGGDKHE